MKVVPFDIRHCETKGASYGKRLVFQLKWATICWEGQEEICHVTWGLHKDNLMRVHEFTPLGHRNEAALNQTAAFWTRSCRIIHTCMWPMGWNIIIKVMTDEVIAEWSLYLYPGRFNVKDSLREPAWNAKQKFLQSYEEILKGHWNRWRHLQDTFCHMICLISADQSWISCWMLHTSAA